MTKLITVVETPTFLKDIKRAKLSTEDHRELVTHLAAHPESGAIMKETGGVRKLRFAPAGRGKSGAYRAIYYYHDTTIPLFAFALYAKNEKVNLSSEERNELRKVIPQIVAEYKGK